MALIALMSLRPRARKSTIRNRTARPRTWGLSLIGKRSRFLGFVEATDQEAAESAVVDGLGLSHKQRKRLVVQELPGMWCRSADIDLRQNPRCVLRLEFFWDRPTP